MKYVAAGVYTLALFTLVVTLGQWLFGIPL